MKPLRKITISQGYVILLVSLAILVSGTHLVTQRIISVNKDFAALINVSGRQRMLSQRIMLYAYEHIQDGSQLAKTTLTDALTEFQDNHEDLINGNTERGIPASTNPHVRSLYFGETDLDQTVRNYVLAARQLIATAPSSPRRLEHLQTMRDIQEDGILANLDRVVFQHQKEAERVLQLTLSYGTLLWLFTLLVLVLEARYLFYPLTKRVENEIQLRRRAEKDLLRSNRELEDFAYVASHDLKAPLRHITSCADIIEKEYAGDLPEEAKGYFNHILTESRHMRRLIESLLEFSRIGRSTDSVDEKVNLSALTDRVIQRMKQIDSAPVQITYEDLPYVCGSPPLLERLFDNLVGNAIKYVEEGVVPDIRISAVKEGSYAIIAFADNGIGIAPEYAEKIFKIFQRLHGKGSSYEGVGLGLAIVKRIVELHGGTIALDTAYTKGARFLVTLPLTKTQ